MEGDVSTMASVTTAVTSAVADVSAQAAPIIAAAIGLSVIFWGAKVLWTKFKGMAK